MVLNENNLTFSLKNLTFYITFAKMAENVRKVKIIHHENVRQM
nr:MAG TPA: hypothetical protein [Caudoviricetes sp.]